MNEPMQIVCFYAKYNHLVENMLYILNVFNLEVKYRNKDKIGFVHPKFGSFEIIFRDLYANNKSLYKYTLKGTKAIYIKGSVKQDNHISKFVELENEYFYPCFYEGKDLKLPVYVVNNFYEFIDIAFMDFKTVYYEPIFENHIFQHRYKEVSYSIKPYNVNAFETKKEAEIFAINEMVKYVEKCKVMRDNKVRAIISYQKQIKEYEEEIAQLEESISQTTKELKS